MPWPILASVASVVGSRLSSAATSRFIPVALSGLKKVGGGIKTAVTKTSEFLSTPKGVILSTVAGVAAPGTVGYISALKGDESAIRNIVVKQTEKLTGSVSPSKAQVDSDFTGQVVSLVDRVMPGRIGEGNVRDVVTSFNAVNDGGITTQGMNADLLYDALSTMGINVQDMSTPDPSTLSFKDGSSITLKDANPTLDSIFTAVFILAALKKAGQLVSPK